MFGQLQNFWPLTLFKTDDLKCSKRLIQRLSVPEQTKQFIFAIPDRQTGSILYAVTVLSLSEQSVSDVEHVIKEVQPNAVIAQIAPCGLLEVQAENDVLDSQKSSVLPTSAFGVLRRCFKEKINKKQYENLAGSLVVKEIFGTGFFGHLRASRRAAETIDAQFLLLESPRLNSCTRSSNTTKATLLEGNHLVSRRKAFSSVSSSTKRSFSWLSSPVEDQMLKMSTQFLSSSLSKAECGLKCTSEEDDHQPRCNFQAPPFARSIYPLMEDLHNIFFDIPSIRRALIYAQKMLTAVNEGEPVDATLLSEAHGFRLAVEGLRIALNYTAHYPAQQSKDVLEFHKLTPEEKCDALITQALKNQVRKFKSVVAVVDAGSLSTLRRYWNTSVPSDFALLADNCFISFDNEQIEGTDRKRRLVGTPVAAVGAGATALWGASSLSKVMPASTLFKMVSYKIPVIFKFSFAQMQRSGAVGLSKILSSMKILAPGMASKTSAGFKASVSAEKIRRVTHSAIAFSERTSLYAMRTSFYEIMRNRRIHPFQFVPWATFCCSVVTCGTLLSYGDRIESAAESFPSAPTIASWGRGIQSLHQASEEVGQANKVRLQETLQSLMCSMKKMKIQ